MDEQQMIPPTDEAQSELPSVASGPTEGESEKIRMLRRTALLWKSLPIPADPEPAPEENHDEFAFPDGRQIIAARVRGKKHKHSGTNCDDWYAVGSVAAGEILCIAVADGAGSRAFSRIGARVSCETAVGSLCESFQTAIRERAGFLDALNHPNEGMERLLRAQMSLAVQKARNAVYAAYTERLNCPGYETMRGWGDLSATLLLCVIIPAGEEWLALSFQVGDGVIALLDTTAPYDQSLTLLGQPDSGDFAGETSFLPSEKLGEESAIQERIRIHRGKFDTALLMTDGVADDYYPADPELRRLYFDLTANGILPVDVPEADNTMTIPEPLALPDVPVQYAWRILETAGLTLRELWDNRQILACSRDTLKLDPDEGQGTRLARWLAHYAETGSFDDRTLVLVRLLPQPSGSAAMPEAEQEGSPAALEDSGHAGG